MASATDSSKRRRLLGDAASLDAISCLLSDLPSGVLTNVANYLGAPSRLFFAAALTTHQIAAASDERNTAIVGNEWTTLDFGDIEKDLAVKLTDRDISAVLVCIDAANRVKKLKLTNCIHITGVGLEPLRGSIIIEQIDLSLVGEHQSPILKPNPPISCEFVVPILDSIIERGGCSLRHLQFPSVWRAEEERVQFEHFIGRYNQLLVNRGGNINCAKCSEYLPPENESWIDNSGTDISQKYTCYECLKHYCADCTDDDDDHILFRRCCYLCEKRLCSDCQKYKWCVGCDVNYCVGCMDFTECSGCHYVICKDCIASEFKCIKCCRCEGLFCEEFCDGQSSSTHCDSCKKSCCNDCAEEGNDEYCFLRNRCDSCKKNCCRDCIDDYDWPECRSCSGCFCGDCNEKKGIHAIQICDDCNTHYCGDCRVYLCQEKKSHKNCAGCIQLAGPFLLEENTKVRRDYAEVKAENKKLKDQIGGMKDHINYLKEQLQYQKEQVKELAEK